MTYQKVPSTKANTTSTTTTDPAMATRGYLPYVAALVVVVLVTFSSLGDSFGNSHPQKDTKDIDTFLNAYGELLASFSMFNLGSESEPIVCEDGKDPDGFNDGWANVCTCFVTPCEDELKSCSPDGYADLFTGCFGQLSVKVGECVNDNFDMEGDDSFPSFTDEGEEAFKTCLLKEAQRDVPNDFLFMAASEANAVIKCVTPIYDDCFKNNPRQLVEDFDSDAPMY